MPEDNNSNTEAPKLSFFQLMLSAIAAAFGVQSDKNRKRDFQQKSIWPFVAAGLLFTAIFVLTLILVVKLVLGNQ